MMKTAILLVALQFAIGANLPEDFQRCHVNDSDSSSCFKVAIVDALQKIGSTGIPSLNLEPIQPLFVKSVKVDHGGRGPVVVKVQLANLQIDGITESSILNFQMHNYEIKAESLTPLFKVEADYVLDGQILVLPLRGTGKCTIILESLVTYHDIKGKPVSRNGEIYLDLQNYNLKMRIKHMSLNFKNLFNGDKLMGDTLNRVLNDNWQLLYQELRSSFEKVFGDVFLEYAKNIFDRVPYNNIFLE